MSKEEEIEFTVRVRIEGRITIPKAVRDTLMIKEGSFVRCKISKVRTR